MPKLQQRKRRRRRRAGRSEAWASLPVQAQQVLEAFSSSARAKAEAPRTSPRKHGLRRSRRSGRSESSRLCPPMLSLPARLHPNLLLFPFPSAQSPPAFAHPTHLVRNSISHYPTAPCSTRRRSPGLSAAQSARANTADSPSSSPLSIPRLHHPPLPLRP